MSATNQLTLNAPSHSISQKYRELWGWTILLWTKDEHMSEFEMIGWPTAICNQPAR